MRLGPTRERSGLQGARLIYPNITHAAPGARFDFWNYDPDQKGWYVYGGGSVTADGKSIVPDAGVVIYSFTGAMVGNPGPAAPPDGPNPGCSQPGCKPGDPVDAGTGLFTLEKTDVALPGVMPITLRRSYRQKDNVSRAFGIGASHSYDCWLAGDANPWTYQDLILADGGRIHYTRLSSGTSYGDAVYEHTGTQT